MPNTLTAFTPDHLLQLNPDVIICLYVDPCVTRKRIQMDPAGRPLPSDFELELHANLQASLATQYAFELKKPCYLLDSSIELEELAKNFVSIAKIV